MREKMMKKMVVEVKVRWGEKSARIVGMDRGRHLQAWSRIVGRHHACYRA